MLDSLEAIVAVANAAATDIVLGMVEVGSVNAAAAPVQEGHLAASVIAEVTDEAGAAVAQAVGAFMVEAGGLRQTVRLIYA
jgi:hypothetical protein